MDTKHEQVPFITLKGKPTTVDKGMRGILKELRRLGVETQFSCEGSRGSAYVLGDRRSFKQALKKIHKQYKNEVGYSPSSRRMVRHFLEGYHEHEFAIFRNNGHRDTRYKAIFSRGKKGPFRMEWTYSYTYGLRLTVRWPQEMTNQVLYMLCETDREETSLH